MRRYGPGMTLATGPARRALTGVHRADAVLPAWVAEVGTVELVGGD